MTNPLILPVLWAQLSTLRAMQVGSGLVFLLALVAMYLEETRAQSRQPPDAFAFDFYRATAAWCLWWCGIATALIRDPTLGAMALSEGGYTVASGTALFFLGHVLAAMIFMVARLRELLGLHEWQQSVRAHGHAVHRSA